MAIHGQSGHRTAKLFLNKYFVVWSGLAGPAGVGAAQGPSGADGGLVPLCVGFPGHGGLQTGRQQAG